MASEGSVSRQMTLQDFVVQGQVSQENGRFYPNTIIHALDHDLKQEANLGQATTDTNGFYRIQYTTDQLSVVGKTSADLSSDVFLRSDTSSEREAF